MIGDNLSRATNRKLKLWGTIALLGSYLLCVVQARQWPFYAVICGPVMMIVWIWGLGAYKRPRETGKVINFGNPIGFPMGRVTLRSGGSIGFQSRPDPHPAGQVGQRTVLESPIVRPDPHPGGQDFQYASSVNIRFKVKKGELELEPPVRVSRYKKVSDKTKWLI